MKSKLAIILILVLGSLFIDKRSTHAQVENTRDLFPVEVSAWKLADAKFELGIVEAETLRERILSKSPSGETYAKRICDAIAKCQVSGKTVLADGTSIARFQVSQDRLIGQLNGRQPLEADAFSGFDGQWFGRWDQSEVNHDWHPIESFLPPKQTQVEGVYVSGAQYAWIGNGFGWNYLVSKRSSGTQKAERGDYVLGMVYYFQSPDFKTITSQKPHVGFYDSPTRLVWITDREVFLEEVFSETDPLENHYVITALFHDLFADQPTTSPDGVQADYGRLPNKRPGFKKFRW